ncbi:MAG: hypothetical protein N2053_02810 [Chitinispirillaceae bacterium]|nr:hypothetical protein [Chitinispirillaceae bacterium]
MRRSIIVIAIIIGLIKNVTSAAPTPITSFGSNPYFSTELFPQDLLLRSGSYLFYSPVYQNSPWWGDIDEPKNKPNSNNDYTITGVEVVRDGGSFKHSAAIHSITNNIGYAYSLKENFMLSGDIDYNFDIMGNNAEGNFTAYTEYYPEGATLPFSYSLTHLKNRLTGCGIAAFTIKDIPVGIKFKAGFDNTLMLKKDLSFSKLAKNGDGSFTDSLIVYRFKDDDAKAMWGWSEAGCNHVFGLRGTQGDTWLQNEYSLGPIYNINLIGGITLNKIKGGIYFRNNWGHLKQYRWKSSDVIVANDTVVSRNFIGRYVVDDMAKIKRTTETKVFGNLKWKEERFFSLNTFASLEYIDSTEGSALSSNLQAESSSKEKIRRVSLEFDPNLLVTPREIMDYVNAALIIRYQYSRYSNTSNMWVGGGTIRTYWNTSTPSGWEDVWESFSYANENSLDIGADFAAMFPLLKGINNLSLHLRFFGDVRFTLQKKYYGENSNTNNIVNFIVENTRKNYWREIMFNTNIMLQYRRGPYMLQFYIIEPLLYSVLSTTSVTDANGRVLNDGNNYPLKKSPLWITQNGISFALYASYDIVLPFLR